MPTTTDAAATAHRLQTINRTNTFHLLRFSRLLLHIFFFQFPPLCFGHSLISSKSKSCQRMMRANVNNLPWSKFRSRWNRSSLETEHTMILWKHAHTFLFHKWSVRLQLESINQCPFVRNDNQKNAKSWCGGWALMGECDAARQCPGDRIIIASSFFFLLFIFLLRAQRRSTLAKINALTDYRHIICNFAIVPSAPTRQRAALNWFELIGMANNSNRRVSPSLFVVTVAFATVTHIHRHSQGQNESQFLCAHANHATEKGEATHKEKKTRKNNAID